MLGIVVDPDAKVASLTPVEQKEVEILKALVANADVILMDEPTVGVDVGAKAKIYATIRKLRDAGTAVIVISSDLEEVMTLSDRILIFNSGRFTRFWATGV